MNVLIIGGAGYIGSHVVREFLDRGHGVTVFDNLSSGLRENLFPEAAFVHGDILDYAGLSRAMRDGAGAAAEGAAAKGASAAEGASAAKGAAGFQALVHLAAFKAAGESMLKPEKYSRNNINGAVNILNAAAEAGIACIVFSSSAAVYGEPRYLPVDERHPANPENYYGFTKLEIERFLGWYERLRGIRFACLRYFNAAGYDVRGRVGGLEQNPANLIPAVMETAAGMRGELRIFGGDYDTPDGTCVRDYVHVNDLAAGHAAALDYISGHDASLTLNLGSETGSSVLEVVETARKITGRPIPAKVVERRPGDPARLTASSGLARELLGWKAEHSDLETLLRTSWEAYRKRAAR
ncbi:MAG: UDP-glucose 4-epimerase GalE [Treponema sp.]|jgi:UDP-glucose 4-epimerase|nr:UDP-glucose 4-epimerase GalE [Treponema sp.]